MDSRVNNLILAINKLRDFNVNRDDLRSVKSALNTLVPDGNCVNFVYTLNTDKIPFGCIVFPIFTSENINSFLIAGESVKIKDYEVELDSKVFDYGLTNEQVAAIILFNVYHMVKDKHPCDNVREAIDDFFVIEGKNLVIRDSVQYQAILLLGLADALSQVTSCLNLPNIVQSDPYLDDLELDDWKEGLDKLYQQIPGCENEVLRQPKLSILQWCLRLYDNVEKERVPALHLLKKIKHITASQLYNAKFDAAIYALNKIETDAVVTEAVKHVFTEAKRSRSSWFANLRYNGLREIENDLYSFYLVGKNSEDEYELIYNLKQINARLALLDDYIRENPDDTDLTRWINLKSQYLDLRDTLAKKKLHDKPYGIFVDYDQLDDYYNKYKMRH